MWRPLLVARTPINADTAGSSTDANADTAWSSTEVIAETVGSSTEANGTDEVCWSVEQGFKEYSRAGSLGVT